MATYGEVKMTQLKSWPEVCAAALALMLGLAATAVHADPGGAIVTWKRIVGTFGGSQPVGVPGCFEFDECLESTPVPWVVTRGSGAVNLANGAMHFAVDGLVVAADPSFASIGTPSVITMVKGTLLCNDTGPGLPEFTDTEAVSLSASGSATFSGHIDVLESCLTEPDDIVFLIRIADVSDPAFGFLIDLWNAFGAVRLTR
jgi:hypothetical protein